MEEVGGKNDYPVVKIGQVWESLMCGCTGKHEVEIVKFLEMGENEERVVVVMGKAGRRKRLEKIKEGALVLKLWMMWKLKEPEKPLGVLNDVKNQDGIADGKPSLSNKGRRKK